MRPNQKNQLDNQFVVLHDDDWFQKQKISGRCVAECLRQSRQLIENKTPNISLKDIESFCLEIIKSFGCSPTFLGYHGFPGAICASVNKQLVHGIPTDYRLQEGDIVKIDLGATYDRVISDAAITAIYGEAKKEEHKQLIKECENALKEGIKAVEIGKQIGCIGEAIYNSVKFSKFKLITKYGGHGLSLDTPHAEPFIHNKAKSTEGIRIQPGLSIAIEPMLCIGSDKTTVGNDGWTVYSLGGMSAHYENSIYVGEDKIHIMTEIN